MQRDQHDRYSTVKQLLRMAKRFVFGLSVLVLVQEPKSTCAQLECAGSSSVPIVIPRTQSVRETEAAGKRLFSFYLTMNSTWTIKLVTNTNSSSGLRTFFVAALRFEGTPKPNQCSGQNRVCDVTLGKVMDLEYLRDKFGFTGLAVKYELVCSGGSRRDPFDLLLSAVGEFKPGFNTSPLRINVTENTKVGTAVISLYDHASDKDVGEFIRSFDLLTNTSLFSMGGRYGNISVKSALDFESLSAKGEEVVQLTVRMEDSRNGRSNDTLIITITDADDLPPVFSLKCPDNEAPPCEVNYTASVSSSCVGTVNNIQPHDIAARDGDALAYGIEYSLKSGPNQPPFEQYLTMEKTTGKLLITQALGGAYGSPAKLALIVQATEVSPAHRSSTAGLVVCVQEDEDATLANHMTLIWILFGSLNGLLFLVLACYVLKVLLYRKEKRKRINSRIIIKTSDEKAGLNLDDRTKSSGTEGSVQPTSEVSESTNARRDFEGIAAQRDRDVFLRLSGQMPDSNDWSEDLGVDDTSDTSSQFTASDSQSPSASDARPSSASTQPASDTSSVL